VVASLFQPRSVLQLLHVWWPVALGWSVAVVVQRATGRAWDPAGLGVLLIGIAAAYSLDRALDITPESSPTLKRLLLMVTLVAGALGLVLLPWVPLPSAAVVPLAGLLALSYRRLKRVLLAKTIGVPLVWTWCGMVLPAGDGSWLGWRAMTEPVALPLFLLIAAGCLLCDVKDAARDRAAGVPSIPALVGVPAALRIATAVAVVALVAAIAAGRPGLACSAAVLCGVAFRPTLVATDVVGPLVVDLVLTLPGVLIAAHLI
jgi:hypothetical protein